MVLSLVRYDFRHHLYITFVTSRLALVAYFALMNPKYFHTTRLTVRYVRGADPIIKLLDESKNVVETLGIDKWKTDSVEAFFDERLNFICITLL
jgi:hypothetical protein